MVESTTNPPSRSPFQEAVEAERQRIMGGGPAAAPSMPELSGFEAAVAAERARLLGERASMAPVTPADDGTAFSRGLQRGLPQTFETLAAGAGALGFERAQEYLSGIATERQMELLRQNPELLEGVDFRDVRGVSSFLTYLGELAGEQAPLIGATVLGTGAAAAAGATLPVAAAIGTVAASGPLLFGGNVARRAEVLGVDPSELTGRDVGAAAATAVGQTALEAATNALLVARVGAPIARQLLQNAGAEAIAEVGQQALERAQAGLDVDSPDAYEEYLQAGFAGAALGGAFTGVSAGLGAATGQTPSAIRAREEAEQLERDQAEEAARNTASLADVASRPEPTEFAPAAASDVGAIALPAPEPEAFSEAEWRRGFRQYARERVRDIQPVSLKDLPINEARAIRLARQGQGITNQTQLGQRVTLPEIQAVLGTEAAAREVQRQKPMSAAETAFAPIEGKSFSQQQFDAVLDTVRATGKINFPEVKKALQRTQQAPVPTSMVNDVLTEASRRGLVQRQSKPRKDGGARYTYQLSPALTASQTEGSISQRQFEADRLELEQKRLELRRLQEEARRIEQTGVNLEGKKRKYSKSERDRIARLQSEAARLASNMQRATAQMGAEPAVRPVPALELSPDRQRQVQQAEQSNRANEAAAVYEPQIAELKRRLSEAQKAVARGDTTSQGRLDLVRGQIAELQSQREVARSAALRGEPVAPPSTLRYTPRFEGIVGNLTNRLAKLGLGDVSVKVEGLINQDAAVEGLYTPQGRVIKLASSIYDANLSDAQLEARLSEVMDHELLHALWEMGLLTDAERASLIRAAGERQYVAMVDGKPTKRKYTYLQRAQRMYGDESLEVQQEEAVAEMFRNYVAGRDNFAGRPQSVFRRIVNFFKSFFKAASDTGAQSPADIFQNIQSGQVGARERAAVPGATERESRRVTLPKALEKFTALDLYDSAGNFRDMADYGPNGKRLPRNKEIAIEMMHKGRKRVFSLNSEKDINDLARIMAAEAEAALETDRNAIGWYGTTLQKAKGVLSILHPEIQTDPGANGAMDYAIAVTSNGMAVVDNFINANKQYENWQETGRFLEEGYGNQGQSMVNAFKFYNALKDRGLSDTDIADYLSQETTPGQLRKDAIIRDIGLTVDSKEFAATPVRVSYIMGPKIGQGFYQNLRGNFDPLTMDRWWMRMFNRLTGKPFKEVTDKLVQSSIDRVAARLRSNDITEFEAELRDRAIENLGIDIATPENVKDLGIEINRLFQREFVKADKNNRPAKTELFLAADRLAQNAMPQLQEDPRGPADRVFMREVTNRARDILRSESNVDISNADIQALLWYAEKRLWDAYGVRKGRGEDNDYVDGAIALLRDKGISDEQIAEALPAGDRYRIDPRLDTRRADGGVRGPVAGSGAVQEAEVSGPAIAEDRDGTGDAGDRAGTKTPVRESRRPTQRPDAEVGDADPVTADDLRRLTELGDEFFRRPGWAVITATREDLDPRFKEAQNIRANNDFRQRLNYEGVPYIEVSGRYQGEDQGTSFLIIAPESTAKKYGKQLMQESILTNDGLVYTLRPLPSNPATGEIMTGPRAREEDFYSETPDGFAFSMGLDFTTGPGVSVFPENAYERTDRPQLPIRKSDDKVELLHWSNQKLTSVDPAFAGTGPLSGVERRRGARLGFFGINPRESQTQPGTGYVKESGLGSILHRALVDPNDLYPWVSDPAKFKENLTGRTADERIQEIEDRIRDAGYKGYYVEDDGNVRSPSAPLGNVAAMFEAIPVEPVSQERESRRPMYSVTAAMNAASGTSNKTAIHNQMTQYTDIADWLGRAIGTVVRKPGAAQRAADKFIQKTQDSFIPVARMIKELKERGLTINDVVDPYLQEQLSRSRAGGLIDERKRTIYKQMADAVNRLDVSNSLRNQLIAVSASQATSGKGLADHIFGRTASTKQAMAEIYLYAKHALERNSYIRQIDPANNRGSGMSDAEAQAILNWFNANLSQQNRSAIAQIESSVQAIVADTNAVRVDGDLIPANMLNVRHNKKKYRPPSFKNYVPLRGQFDDDGSVDYGNIGGGRGFSVSGREDPRALGRGSYGGDILGNILFQNTNSIIRAEQNKVALSLVDLLESNPQETSAYGKILKKAPQRRILNANGTVQYTVDQGYKDRSEIVIAKRNGEEIIVEMVDANLAGAFNGKNVWNTGHANVIFRGLGKLNRYLSNIVTSWNPEFVITNFARDVQSAGINISEFEIDGLRKDVIKNIPNAIVALKRGIRDEDFSGPWGAVYQEFTKSGGQSAANPMNNLQDQIDEISSLMRDFGEGGSVEKMRKAGGKVLGFLEDYNTVVENALRLTTYEALRKRGYTEARAAQAARSVTVDFTKTGDMGQFMNSLYLFYNAALQGSFFMFRAAARSKRVRRVLAGAIATGAVMDMINSMVSGEDEAGIDEYDKIPDYVLEHNWVIMLPEGMAPDGRRYIAIPMPYGLNFFYNTGRAIARTGRGGYEVDQGAASIAKTLLEVINPVGGTEHFLNFAAPTFADPFISLYGTNVDFTGRDIVREPFPNQQVAQSHLYWNSTSPTAVNVSQALNSLSGGTPTLGGWADVSPDTLEFWFNYVTGGAGRFVQRTAELPIRVAEAQSAEDVIREVPFIRRLFGSVSSREDLGTYIRERDQVLRARSELRAAADAGDRQRIIAARERFPDELRIAEAVNNIENQRRQITRRINDIQGNPRIPEERKRELVDRLDEQRQRIILRGLQIMRAERD